MNISKIILINPKKYAFSTITKSLPKAKIITYESKKIIIHAENGKTKFIYNNKTIHFKNSYVFTHLRGNDGHFTSILREYLKLNQIPINREFDSYDGNANGKITQMARFNDHKLHIPKSIICRKESYYFNQQYILNQFQFPLIYKTDGSRGENVKKIDSQKQLEIEIETIEPGKLGLIQEYIHNTFDTRTIVVFDKIIGTIKRTRQSHPFINNISQGGKPDLFKLTPTEKKDVLKAMKLSQCDFGGVDLIHTKKHPIILEVNIPPQVEGFEKIHGTGKVFQNIAKQINKKLSYPL